MPARTRVRTKPSQGFLARTPRPFGLAVLAKPRRVKAGHRGRCRGASSVWLPGQHFDVESGLSYNINRDYQVATGRYIQSDPIGLDGGMNTYGTMVGILSALRRIRLVIKRCVSLVKWGAVRRHGKHGSHREKMSRPGPLLQCERCAWPQNHLFLFSATNIPPTMHATRHVIAG